MSDTQLILDAISKQEDKTEKQFEELQHQIRNMREDIVVFDKKTTELDIHLKEAREDIHKFEKILHGNGAPGLKLQVEMLDRNLEIFKESLKKFSDKQDLESEKETRIKLNEDKNSTAIKVALITSSLSFLAFLINLFVNIFT